MGDIRVLVTGSSGFIGTAVVAALEQRGDGVVRLGRGAADAGGPTWDPDAGTMSAGALDGIDAVVHLAGRRSARRSGRPSRSAGSVIRSVEGHRIARAHACRSPSKPSVLISGSAIGYYGDRGDEVLDEASGSGDDFLALVAAEWEAAAQPAADAGIRLVTIRTGIVLDPSGGVLAKLLLPFRLGIGGRVASGKQWMSWIALADTVGAILHALDHDTVRGPVNLTAPNPATNAELTKTLGTVLHRPTLLPTPLLPLKLRYGGELVKPCS